MKETGRDILEPLQEQLETTQKSLSENIAKKKELEKSYQRQVQRCTS